VDRFRVLTVPELRREAALRQLSGTGKKSQLLLRLAIWARDEIVKSSSSLLDDTDDDNRSEQNKARKRCSVAGVDKTICYRRRRDSEDGIDDDDTCDDSCSSNSSLGEELELFNGGEGNSDAESDEEYPRDKAPTPSTLSRAPKTSEWEDEPDNEVFASLRSIFGHESFRPGQEWAIQRCLNGEKSLLVAPTGFGKSLCYALPAALMEGVCVVVSPLISLIQDQLRSLPPRIPAATLSGSISASTTAAILDDVIRKRIKILFVSPERLTSPAFRRLFNPIWNPDTKLKERKFPEISLLCIDEAHCISQWAHNFRPCFLRFKGLLQTMRPKSVLAITATAGPRVIEDIAKTLVIDSATPSDEEPCESQPELENKSIRIIRSGRDNIDVMGKFVANHEERLDILAKILTPVSSSKDLHKEKSNYAGILSTGSVIIYVWRQKDTEAVAEYIVASGVHGGVTIYHGGMDSNGRSKSQSKFMRGKARICVATVAFGLGIDKSDVEGVRYTLL
jgi:ATP-dependent DNA helicase Q4